MDKHYVDERVNVLAGKIYELERVVDNLEKTVYILSTEIREISKKANTGAEIIKQINDSKSVGMDSKVFISLDGRVTLESIVEQTADSKMIKPASARKEAGMYELRDKTKIKFKHTTSKGSTCIRELHGLDHLYCSMCGALIEIENTEIKF